MAGKIVETFLDPEYNQVLGPGFTGDFETKQELANSFYERFPPDVLDQFAAAYRNPSLPSMREALERVVAASRQHLNPELAEAFEGSLTQLDAIAAAELEDSELGSVSGTLNMPCLVSFLMLVENLGRQGLVAPQKVVHDRHHAYEEGYKKIFEIHQGLHDWFARTADEDLLYTNLDNIPSFEVADSKTTLPIQAADVLAGVVNYVFSLAMCEELPTSADWELANALVGGFLVNRPRVTWALFSEHCMRRLAATFVGKPDGQSIKDAAAFRTASIEAHAFPALDAKTVGNGRPKADLPLFGIIGRRSGGLMMMNDVDYPPAPKELNLPPKGPAALLFHQRTDAETALASFDSLTEPQDIVEFGPRELPDLIAKLEAVSAFTSVLVFDAWTERGSVAFLPSFISGMTKSLGRVKRLVRSGLTNVVFKRHDFGDHTVYSMLTSAGKYVAMLGLNGEFREGASREEAVAAIVLAHDLKMS